MDAATVSLEAFGLPGLIGGAIVFFFYLYARDQAKRVQPEYIALSERLGRLEGEVENLTSRVSELRDDLREFRRTR